MDSRLDAPQVVRRVRTKLFPGAIVLLHDGVARHSKYARTREATVLALPDVLDICSEQGLTPMGLSQVLVSHGETGPGRRID
jgi:hypothetical protein